MRKKLSTAMLTSVRFSCEPLLVSMMGFLAAHATVVALINPKFTPIDLVRQSDAIVAADVVSSSDTATWKLVNVESLSGARAAAMTLRSAVGDPNQSKEIAGLLTPETGGGKRVLLFAASQGNETRGYLHVDGVWLALAARARDLKSEMRYALWEIEGLAPHLAATFAGGTDMLIRMARYILADPNPTVPVRVGTYWMDRSRFGRLDGPIGGMKPVDPQGDGSVWLFVAAPGGDRLFRPAKDFTTLEEITTNTKLATRSRRFAWIDFNRDGLADLASWDGKAVTIHLFDAGGTFRPPDSTRTFPLAGLCWGLEAISVAGDGAPALLVTTDGLPFLLEPSGKRTVLPGGKRVENLVSARNDGGVASIVADFDNDGFPDVVLPRRTGSIYWKGRLGGFAEPTTSPLRSPLGSARFTLGDFDGDGFLDVFLGDRETNCLWENDGAGRFREVAAHSGSLNYKSAPDISDCLATDLNHDGRPDLALCYADGGFVYHFNRGYRCFGEEGELRLVGDQFREPLTTESAVACAVADWNRDGSLDVAVALADGNLYCYWNDLCDRAGVNVRLRKGTSGPVTVSLWQGEKRPFCTATQVVNGLGPARLLTVRGPGQCVVRYTPPGRSPQSKTLTIRDRVEEVIIE